MRVVLFDWTTGGHHARYLRQVAAALSDVANVSVAAPDLTLCDVSDLPVRLYDLRSARPAADMAKPLTPQHAEMASAEINLMEQTIAAVQPDYLIHMYGDQVIRWLVRR